MNLMTQMAWQPSLGPVTLNQDCSGKTQPPKLD
jgi:hypothetical protein